MRIKLLALSLMLAILPCYGAGLGSVKQSRVIDLVAKDSGLKIATIHVDGESLLYEFNSKTEAGLFRDESVYTINNTDQTYRFQSYTDLVAAARQKAEEIARSQGTTDSSQGVVLKLTNESDTVNGLRVRKLTKTNQGNHEADFWVSNELIPPGLRALGERMRDILPKDYWSRVHGNPGLIEIIVLFGVPLVINAGQSVYHARLAGNSKSDSLFQVPAGYKRLDN
jgi:hypothetical protein